MSWAQFAKDALREGKQVIVKPRGNSMAGKVDDGDIVTLKPITIAEVAVGDIVLCRVKGNDYLHLVKAKDGDRILIGNNKGRENGWIRSGGLFGKAINIEKGK